MARRKQARRQPPAEKTSWFRSRLLHWYQKNGRRFWWRKRRASPFEVVISEVLLQRTQAQAVERFIRGFVRRYPDWQSLARAPLRQLQNALKPLGLWRRRAVALRSLARKVSTVNGALPGTREALESLPGVGQYIASAVLTFCYHKREPLLDVNMARVLERFFGPRQLVDIRYDPYLQTLARQTVDPEIPQQYNWAVLDLAALVCTPRKPKCEVCPLSQRCSYYLRLKQP